MVRMRASWSSAIWELATSLLERLISDGKLPAFVGERAEVLWGGRIVGKGGRGMAGGGDDGNAATEALFREVIELERSLKPSEKGGGELLCCNWNPIRTGTRGK